MRRRGVLAAMGLLGLLVAAFVIGRLTAPTQEVGALQPSNASPLKAGGLTELPTVKCKTSRGAPQPAAQLSPTTPVPLPPSFAEGLAAYRDSAGTMVIAPRGFNCEAGIGVDGSEHVTAFPKGQINPGEHPEHAGAVVTIDIARACQGCIAEAVCTLFPEAKPVPYYYGGIEGEECPEKPLREEVSYPAPSTVLFFDPPHVNGAGFGSGGNDPSFGAMSYLEPIGVRKVSCTLPPEQSGACTGIVGAILAAAPLGG